MKITAYRIAKWSKEVKVVNGYVCEICKGTKGLQSHHINDRTNHPEQALDVTNGVVLCNTYQDGGLRCHYAFHILFKGNYRRKCTRSDWERFLALLEWSEHLHVKLKV